MIFQLSIFTINNRKNKKNKDFLLLNLPISLTLLKANMKILL